MQSIVLDTNILVSSLIVRQSIPAQIVRLTDAKLLQTRYNDNILSEYTAVLSRKKFNFRLEDIASVIQGIINAGISVSPIQSTIPMPDESDRKFYDVAKSAGSILITGNGKHYPSEPFILSPTDFIRMYQQGE
jgi:putative PIN family toxin of toxin-antitoxin system